MAFYIKFSVITENYVITPNDKLPLNFRWNYFRFPETSCTYIKSMDLLLILAQKFFFDTVSVRIQY